MKKIHVNGFESERYIMIKISEAISIKVYEFIHTGCSSAGLVG